MIPDRLPRRPTRTVSPSRAWARRLADDAELEFLAACRERFHHFQRAVVGRAFLVARDQHPERARRSPDTARRIRRARVHHRRKAALHVGRAAAERGCPSADDSGERIHLPLLARPRRNDVGVAREHERGCGDAAARPEVVHLAEPQRLGMKSPPREADARSAG